MMKVGVSVSYYVKADGAGANGAIVIEWDY